MILQPLAELSKLSPSTLLKRRYQKFRRMGEGSRFSQEAMNREVELLLNISSVSDHTSRNGRSQRRKVAEDATHDVAAADVEAAASD